MKSKPYLIRMANMLNHEGAAFVEFREFPDANRLCESINIALWWADRIGCRYNLNINRDYRFWSDRPTKTDTDMMGWVD